MTDEQYFVVWHAIDLWFHGMFVLLLIVAAYRGIRWLYRALRAVDRLTKS